MAAISDAAPESWRRAAFTSGATLPVTAAELQAIGEQLRQVLAPYAGRLIERGTWPSEARFVRILVAATPLPAAELADPAEGNHSGTDH